MKRSKLVFLCMLMETFLLAVAILNPILDQVVIWSPDIAGFSYYGDLNYRENIAIVSISEFAKSIIVSAILLIFYKTFRSIRHGHEFNDMQISRIYTLGWLVAIYAIYSFLIEIIIFYIANNEFSFNFTHLMLLPVGVGLAILGYVLTLALELKNEQELII